VDDKVTAHPNDASKPIVQLTKMSLDADWEVGEGTLSASLSDQEEWNAGHTDASLAEKILAKETWQAELSWDGKITDDLDISLSLEWKSVTDWMDSSKDSTDMALQIQLNFAI